jgi:hypothetical protein
MSDVPRLAVAAKTGSEAHAPSRAAGLVHHSPTRRASSGGTFLIGLSFLSRSVLGRLDCIG